jgi:hypothetical protein
MSDGPEVWSGIVKTSLVLGIILIAIGIFALAYQGITYTKRENVLDVGPLHTTKDTTKTIPLPPVLGGIALAGGVVLIAVGSKRG